MQPRHAPSRKAHDREPPRGSEIERRRDPVLRAIVERCQRELAPRGFQLEERGNAYDKGWVRFRGPGQGARGERGSLLLLLAHGRRERAMLVNTYFVDAASQLPTLHSRFTRHYKDPSELPFLARRVVQALAS